jgi:hypothetical protein
MSDDLLDDLLHDVAQAVIAGRDPMAVLDGAFGFHEASPTKRRGRPPGPTAAVRARYDALVELAREHGPASVRHIYYRATVAGAGGDPRLADITKNDSGYGKVQRALLQLRRDNRMPYHLIVDSTRWMRKPDTYGGREEFLRATAATYRRDLWRDSSWRVEVWCESDSIASTLADITDTWDVALMVCRGYSSETFAYNAASAWTADDRDPVVLYIGDHDPAGLNIEKALRSRLHEFYGSSIAWERLGVTWAQVEELDLPGTRPKKKYGFPLAVEAEALPPQLLRKIVDDTIRAFVDPHRLRVLKVAEESDRDWLTALIERQFAA